MRRIARSARIGLLGVGVGLVMLASYGVAQVGSNTGPSCGGTCAAPEDTDDCSMCCSGSSTCSTCCGNFGGAHKANCQAFCDAEFTLAM